MTKLMSTTPISSTASGLLMVNADDWGRDELTTNRIFDCSRRGAVSSVSAMVFMEDSERAATLAREHEVDAGLHLNFTSAFTARGLRGTLLDHHEAVARHLLRHRLAQAVFHPGLAKSFEYLVKAQLDEFRRIYGEAPHRLDGHHHMHLCANVLVQKLLPANTAVRRSFSFERGEKSLANRLYRGFVDSSLGRRHKLTDYFFSLPPLEPPARLQKIYDLARVSVVEVETHPVEPTEYDYLAGGRIFQEIGDIQIAAASPWLN